MIVEEISLAHSDELREKLYNMDVRLSEYSFANLYLFRKTHNYRILREDECLFITGHTYDGESFVLPLCEKDEPDMDKMENMISIHGMLFPVSEDWLKYFPEEKYNYYHNENDSDYIYTIEQMSTYAGRKLSKKRNLLKQFLQEYSFERKEITEDNIADVLEIIEKWQNDMSLSTEETDYNSAVEAAGLIKKLHLNGIIYYIDGVPVGYVLGEEISRDTYALHFAKGLKDYKGIYQFMYNDLAKRLTDNIKYMNFEQDLGLQSLRQAKASYKPDHMGEKYRINLKD